MSVDWDGGLKTPPNTRQYRDGWDRIFGSQSRSAKTLYAGYFLGEFGWELMRWQAHLRWLAHNRYEKVVVGCEAGHEFLYEDFAHDFQIWAEPVTMRNVCYSRGGVSTPIEVEGDGKRLVPKAEYLMDSGLPQEFLLWGVHGERDHIVVVHARDTNNLRTAYRNWPAGHWAELVERLAGLGCCAVSVGTEVGSLHVEGSVDCRGVPLSSLANIMAGAKLAVGPSSGPMHFASLCGTAHVVWSDIKRECGVAHNRERYETAWNPFNTPCTFIEHPKWQPSVAEVFDAVSAYL